MVMLHCRGRNRTNLLMSNVFQKQPESHPNGRHHESKGNGRPCETLAAEQVCLHGQEIQRTAWLLHDPPKAPIPVPTSFQPTPISFPGDCGRITLAKPPSHYLLRQRRDICKSWCIGYFLIAVKDLFWLLFCNRVSFNNSGEDIAESMVAKACAGAFLHHGRPGSKERERLKIQVTARN